MNNKNSLKTDKFALEIDNISKVFDINTLGKDLALAHLIKVFSKQTKKQAKVLENINFKVAEGEILGVIGKNGSGKSTLLRIIANVYPKTTGDIKTAGEVFYLTSMGVGLIDKLTMRDNIFLAGAIMGLSQKRIKEIFDQIVEFSELGNYLDMKIKQFSTGMMARLGFSISVFCMKNKQSEILLLDEVFGSGADYDFEKKAILKMEELIKGGATVILVSHNLDLIEKYCHRVLWLETGRVKEIGEAGIIIEKYKNS